MPQNFTSIEDLIREHIAMKHGAGSQSKEMDMPPTPHETHDMQEFAEQETQNAKTYVTSKTEDTITLPPDLKSIGVETSDENELFQATLNKIKLPISDEKIMEDLQAPPSESKRWFATILLYILERAHMTLKKIGTKVVRVFKTD